MSFRALPTLFLVLILLPWAACAQDDLRGQKKTIKIEWASYSTKNYEIRYEKAIPKGTVEKVGRELEEILVQYIAIFRVKPEGEASFKVRFLDSLNTYEQEGGDQSHPGMYVEGPSGKYLLIRQLPFYQLIPTVYHEAFHQYIAMYAEGAPLPLWFNEGMASYYEGMQRDGSGKLDPLKIDRRKVRMVKDAVFTKTQIPLASLLDATDKEFHDKDKESLHYTQSFALVDFLMQIKRGKALFSFAKELRASKDPAKALEKIFGKKRKKLKKIERGFLGYLANLKLEQK